MSPLAEILAQIPFLRGSGDAERADLERIANTHDYPKGNILFYDGERCDAVYFVIDGRVKISLISDEGREVILAVIRPAGVFGIVAALEERGVHIGTAATVTDCKLAKVPVSDFEGWFHRHPSMHRPLIKEMARLVGDAYHKIGVHSLLPVKARLLSTLVDIASEDGERKLDEIIFVRPTHQELADLVGTTRVVVSRLLKELVEEDQALQSSGKVMRVSLQRVLQEGEL